MIRNRSKRNGASQREDRPDFYLFIDAMTYKYHSLIILSLIALNLLVYFVLLTGLTGLPFSCNCHWSIMNPKL